MEQTATTVLYLCCLYQAVFAYVLIGRIQLLHRQQRLQQSRFTAILALWLLSEPLYMAYV